MDSPDMDDLLDSLEEDLPTTKNETSKSLKSPLKNIDDSAINNARQKSSQFDENNKSLNNSFMVKSGNEMNGMDEVLNALEDNKIAMNTVKENVKEELNNSNIESSSVKTVDIPEIPTLKEEVLSISPAFVESEFTQTNEDAEVAAILNSITEKASLEFPEMNKVTNGFPENFEKILNDSTFEETIDVNVSESLTFPIIEETINANIPFSNTLKEEFSTKEVSSLPSNVMLEESISNNSIKAVSDDFKIDELSTFLTTENQSNVNIFISKLEVEENVAKEEDIVSKDVTVTQLNEVSEEVERILKDEIIEIESLNIVIPEPLPQNEKEEPEMHEIMEKMEECIQTLTKDELIVEDLEDQINFEKAKENMDLKEDNSMEPQPEAGDAKPASEAIESELSEHVSTGISSLQTEKKPSEPIGFDMSQDINEELNEELLQELDQMAEEQIKEGTIEAAAVVAAEARNSEPQLEPARSYIPETPLIHPNTVILSTHDLSVVNSNPPLTESELQLGKTKPYWIPDQDCVNCMLCSSRFTVINRRHHCRCCGRVLCSSCCNMKKALPYIEDPEKKQKVCEPCSRTLDKIEDYEFLQAEIQKRQTQRRQLISESEGADNEGGVEEVPSSANPTVVLRKKSVLKSKNSERPETEQKRTVKFLDGVRPGHDNMDSPGPSGSFIASSSSVSAGTVTETQTDELKATKKKIPKGVHRRNRERRVQEEQISLVREDHLFIVDCDAQMTKLSMDKVLKKLIDGEKVMVAIKRNLWVVIQLVNYRNSKVWFFSSQGMATIGSDELCIAFEAQEFDFEIIKEVIQFFADERKRVEENKGNNSDSTENSEVSITDNLSPPRSLFITSLLYLFDHFFLDSLIPSNESLDEKVGIRRCGERISTFYRVPQGEINGIEAAAIIFHRPIGQNFENLPIPSYSPFLIGTFIQKSELIWGMAIPNRLLLKIGLQASHFPFPIVNERKRTSTYLDSSENTVLKVFNDFKNWSYRLPKILGSTVEIENGTTINVRIPKWSVEDIKQILESNRNMLAWASSLTDHSDCHLVAIQNSESTFRTEIFTDVESTREKIGCNFIVLDGSLKNCTDNFQMSIVEDGVIVRVSSETMEEIVKCLIIGASYSTTSQNMNLNFVFAEPFEPKYTIGGLLSPIDHMYLIGKYQYGLNLSRQFRSQMLIPNASEWALRLSTVINIEDGKIPLQFQPRYFEICEQVGTYMAGTIGSFVKALTISDQRQICIRIKLENDMVTYDTATWKGLEQEHYVWTAALDDQLIPYLYQLCPLIQSTFHMELHFSLISIRLLSNVEY
jgi:hypothetical protein